MLAEQGVVSRTKKLKDFAVSGSHPAAARDINIIPPAAKRKTAKEVFFMQERLKDVGKELVEELSKKSNKTQT